LIGEKRKATLLRRCTEAGALAVIVFVFWTLDTLSKRNERLFQGVGLDDFRLIAEQVTSGLAVWMLIPAVAWWLTRFPISPGQIGSKVAGHVLGSALFAAAHYFIMMAMRAVVYPWFGRTWQHSDFWLNNLLVEYQKDIKIYVGIVAIVTVYRRFRQQRSQVADRLAVQTGSGERLLEFGEIDCLEASRNYVSVYANDKEFLLRETLSSLESRLAVRGFLRTHRSFLVNRAHVAGIEPGDSGGQDIVLKSGRKVPLSRSRRAEVRAALGLESA
jgi:hypothetical protein